MTTLRAPAPDRSANHLGLPPPSRATDTRWGVGRHTLYPMSGAGARAAGRGSPPAIPYLARMIFVAVAIVGTGGLIAATPLTVSVPIAVALVAGFIATTLMSDARRPGRGASVRTAPDVSSEAPSSGNRQLQADRETAPAHHGEAAAAPGRGALAVLSLALLASAFVVREELAVVLSAIGLAGLFVLRLTMRRIRPPRRTRDFRPPAPREPLHHPR